jgi:hypothetical protein
MKIYKQGTSFSERREAKWFIMCARSSPMEKCAPSRFQFFAAWACLLAVMSLFAPLAGAAWSSSAMDCCTGDHCTIPKHHHRQAPANADCDSDGGASLTHCSMSCCQDQDRPFATAMNFVMPALASAAALRCVTPTLDAPRSVEIPRPVQPLLPPPRIIASA